MSSTGSASASPPTSRHSARRAAALVSKRASIAARELELLKAARLARARQGVLNFTRYTMPSYEVNWHHRVVASHLNLVAEGSVRRLIIMMQPRAGKTELMKRFVAYYLGRNPDDQVIAASYAASLAAKNNRETQRILDDPRYGELFPGTSLNSSNVRSIAGSWLRNSDEFEIVGRKGLYRSSGVSGTMTGYGLNLGVIDDPFKNRREANSAVVRESVWDWYTSTFFTRLEKDARIVIVMTRWHEDDLVGRLLARSKADPDTDQWTVLNLPAVCELPKSPYDPRDEGDVLWPNKFGPKRMARIKATIGGRDWASLYQQRPAPAEGDIVLRGWWKFYKELPAGFDQVAISADLNIREGEQSDFTVMLVVGRVGGNFYVLDMVRARMGWTTQKKALPLLRNKWPEVTDCYIEDAANGAALVDEVKDTIPGVIAVRPNGSKTNRLQAVAAMIEAGNVYLPDPLDGGTRWAGALIDEVTVFPQGKNDDMVDALVLALSAMRQRTFDWNFAVEGVTKDSLWL